MPALFNALTTGAISDALNSAINQQSGGTSGSADDPRSAMVFTSSLRRILVQKQTNLRDEDLTVGRRSATGFSVQPSLNNQSQITGALQAQRTALNFANTVSDVSNQLVQAMAPIVMEVNPNSVEFTQPKRYTRQDTQRGTVFHHFTNSQGQNNDLLTIKFQGNTGNIWRRAREQDDQDKAIKRLQIWHNLYQLTREPMLLSDGSQNIFYVSYQSPLFPVPIEFQGFFTAVLQFTEDAKKLNSRNYSMEFIVRDTNPDMNVIGALILDRVTQFVGLVPSPTSRVLTG